MVNSNADPHSDRTARQAPGREPDRPGSKDDREVPSVH